MVNEKIFDKLFTRGQVDFWLEFEIKNRLQSKVYRPIVGVNLSIRNTLRDIINNERWGNTY